ncbi:hypothetical protein ACA910_016185 [Epithemia clementina (nom. ined.)]
MKVSYCAASSKQEKMAITKGIVTYMKIEHGSRFLKMENDSWVEINNQAARDKVSHALRFASRNLKTSEIEGSPTSSASSNPPRRPRRKEFSGSEASSVSSSTSEQSESEEGEPVPLAEVFGVNFALDHPSLFDHNERQANSAFSEAKSIATETSTAYFYSENPVAATTRDVAVTGPSHLFGQNDYEGYASFLAATTTYNFSAIAATPTFPDESTATTATFSRDFSASVPPVPSLPQYHGGYLPEHPPQLPNEDAFMESTSQSFRSLQIDGESGPLLDLRVSQNFDTLRSADLEEIFNEPVDCEWEVIDRLAES